MTNQEKEKAAFQSVYDSGFKDALQAAWQAVNVLGAPETARITQEDKFFCEGIEGAFRPSKGCKHQSTAKRSRKLHLNRPQNSAHLLCAKP